MLSHGNFYDEKQHSNKVLPLGAWGSGNHASPTSPCIRATSVAVYDNDESVRKIKDKEYANNVAG